MTEPTYTYVRGTGWVPSTHETLTRVMGQHVVTLELRAPAVNEHYWTVHDDETLEVLMGIIERDYNGAGGIAFEDDPPGVVRGAHEGDNGGFFSTWRFVTITTRKL